MDSVDWLLIRTGVSSLRLRLLHGVSRASWCFQRVEADVGSAPACGPLPAHLREDTRAWTNPTQPLCRDNHKNLHTMEAR